MKLRSVCIISNGYPTKNDPSYAFIRPVAMGFAENGIDCTVIAPQSITANIRSRKAKRPKSWIDYSESGAAIRILQPHYISVSLLKIFGISISTLFRDKAIMRAYKSLKQKPDVLYGHFWDCGIAAAKLSKGRVPVITVSGESRIRVFDCYLEKTVKKLASFITGLICVSTKNLDESRELNLTEDNLQTIVLPNGVDQTLFYPLDKQFAREKLKFDNRSIIGCFIGAFSERKGVNRVIQAAQLVPQVRLILLGKGDNLLQSDQIIYSGNVPHEKIADFLRASDFFILPTLAEGCCNAIVEALACGIPIVSSDLPFNNDLLNEYNSILVNPENIEDIANGIRKVTENKELREQMAFHAAQTGKELSISKRIEKIISFIEGCV